jgi:hypothetical protein
MSTTGTKSLFLFRFPAGGEPVSPEQMQAQYAAWAAWRSRFEREVTPPATD